MDLKTFLDMVGQETGAGDADRAARATLQTLGERIDRGEAQRLAARLPPELAPAIATTTPAEGFDVDEFVARVARRENVEPKMAVRHARAVLDALAWTIPADEWKAVASQLPADFAPLLPRGPYVEVIDADTFLARVAERAGLDLDAADRATDAVLETLARRIAPGEVDDLIVRLPVELHAPLKRGRAEVRGQPEPMRFDQFVDAIAHREGVAFLDAAEHARAVLQVLREAVGEQEFLDITVQLPDQYHRTLGL